MTILPPIAHPDGAPVIERVRHELRRRRLWVAGTERLSPHMIRVTLSGPELAGFTSPAPDDHIRIFLPDHAGELTRRDYTPRHYDAAAGTLVLDFVNHEGGPAAAWARAAKPGDVLEIGGPRGSRIIRGRIDHWLLIGDETALPAIGRRVEALPAEALVTTIIAVPGPEDEQVFTSCAAHAAHWVHRPLAEAAQAHGLLAVLRQVPLVRRSFVWVGAEAGVARAVRQCLIAEKKVPAAWIRAAGYWVKGQADAAISDVGAEE
ncbi:siderophore-interacting protein [Komagataeibacter xylinus]|uniref:siderophore-interacting protein n=1 Tax=Komagataeibacter xylinus TaxID=28448 RepID=UPI00280BBB5E|nr:siderophore-interacting protein [Komagataeibacter xylinus]